MHNTEYNYVDLDAAPQKIRAVHVMQRASIKLRGESWFVSKYPNATAIGRSRKLRIGRPGQGGIRKYP
jgi:hypothetical protein